MKHVAILLLLAGCATKPPNRIDQLVNTPPFDHAAWGIDVEDDEGHVIYDLNAHRLEMPASNRKLFSAATDANCLGFTAQLQTELWLDGEDAIVKGDGDPSFGSQRHESPGFAPFVDALRSRAITHVRDVVADVSRFDRVTIVPSWEVGDLTTTDATPVDAIAYNENVIGNDEAAIDAATNAALQFRDALKAAGISVGGTIHINTTPRSWSQRIAVVESPFVEQLLMSVLKNSVNLYAEMLYKRSTPGGSYGEAQQLERAFLVNEAGLDANEFFFSDGSGLTRRDLVTPAATVKILRWMNAPQRRGIWWLILGAPGGEGTLRRRLLPYADRLRAKTGTLTGVHTLSGVIAGANGRYRYFSIMVNHHLAGEATRVIDQIVEEIAKF
jgi:D-alanyl-D-alanine carboxypeptidase/D-alanyl-D-alanine-endopeptidase (penicillin-binding protein 4)